MGKLWVVVAAAVACIVAAPVARAEEPAPANERSRPIYGIGEPATYHVETEHGVIYGEVVRPVDPTTGTPIDGVPVILTISPYNVLREPNITESRSPAPDNSPVGEYFVPRGYARAVFDVLGTHSSTGCYDYGGTKEREAAAAVVDFLGELPWTNGKVGMIGISYDGTTQLAAAIEQPEHLAAIVPQAALSRHYDYVFSNGVPHVKPPAQGTPTGMDWGFGGPPILDRSDPARNLDLVQSRADECDKVEHTRRAPQDDPVYDDFWVQRDYRAVAHLIDVPVLLEAGWLDVNVHPLHSTRLFQALRPEVPKRLSLGPWDHGDGTFADAMDVRHAWFDEFLLGLDTGVLDEPAVDNQPVNGARDDDDTWPPSETTIVEIELVDGAPSAGQAGVREGASVFTDNNPAFTGYEVNQPDPASSYLAYETPPLPRDVRISGTPRLRLRATSSNDSTHYCVSVATWPVIQAVTMGNFNTRNRNGLHVSEPLVPGQPYDATIELYDTDIVVPQGQSLFISLAGTTAYCRQDDNQPGSTNDILAGSVLELPVSEGAEAFSE
jgi:X-Pro dipeptidyl-peptidase